MEDVSLFLDAPSPSHSYLYTFSDQDQFLDASRSETQSSATSPYDMTFSRDFTGSDRMPSPEMEGEEGSMSPQDQTSAAQIKPAAKRKRENRYKNAPPSVLSRRRAQNRASQRAYRERKDQRIKDLEQMLNDAKARNDVLSQAYADLQAEYLKLKTSSINEQQIPTSYPASGPPAGLGGYVDPTMSALHVSGDLDAYLYPEVGGFSM
ncbi:hypothetical protein J7T55_013372 [Diaporthe amygdali]|uniref:uncharacterized protein n=1 Tax=Phomopsis amygdali TaxID=1214568 RepID=UPI0022FF4596|nr:uncharacterized protein J7T55_013372 [Diaporthe amygdali]KAJ0119137.1 hypothetical protein J7T55_013372 [Diaporthe amygdali]